MKMEMLVGENGVLRCPVCGATLAHRKGEVGRGSLYCGGERVHCFDIAKQGYVHLAPRHSGGGDDKKAVAARTAFLGAGYYAAALEKLKVLVQSHIGSGLLIDAGCGEGYYTNGTAAVWQGCVCGFDLSRDAVMTAARAAEKQAVPAAYAVASVFELPLADGCADGVLNIFAPCAEDEFCRVLRDDGKLIVVGAGEKHLMGLKRAIYDDVHINTTRADLPTQMELVEKVTVEDTVCVEGSEMISALFSMTPYYWRTPRSAADKLAELTSLQTEIAFDFMIYRKKK